MGTSRRCGAVIDAVAHRVSVTDGMRRSGKAWQGQQDSNI